MEEASMPRRGPIEGTSRILRELLRTPRFKKTVSILLSEIDPENAGLLVKTLVWEDPEFFLSLMGAAPDFVNALINVFLELSRQFSSFPTGLLASYLSMIIDRLDAKSLGKVIGETLGLLGEVRDSGGQELVDSLASLLRRFAIGVSGAPPGAGSSVVPADAFVSALLPAIGSAAALLGKEASREGSETNLAVRKMADGIKEIAGENPDFMQAVVAPLVEAGRAVLAGTEAAGEGS
ncbi:MAG TPA: hypothetical protein VIK22_07450 [Candidatus Anoxymicrobiaceae bacterium]